MPRGNYAYPPITEAVIDFRFSADVSMDDLRRIQRRLRDSYPLREDVYESNITVQPGRLAQMHQRHTGFKLISAPENVDIILLNRRSITTSRLAPYNGWSTFSHTARRNLEKWRSVTGRANRITRLGTRYINRIDLPQMVESVDTVDYVLIFPSTPIGVFGAKNAYSVHFTTSALADPAINVIVNTLNVPSPLVDHISVLLDIDVFVERDLPQDDDGIWQVAERLRTAKNDIFESVITDRAREVFDRV